MASVAARSTNGVRLDPLAAPGGILVAAYEEDLASDASTLDLADRPELVLSG